MRDEAPGRLARGFRLAERLVIMGSAPGNLVDFEAALRIVERAAREMLRRPPRTDRVPLLDAAGRVLAEPLVADRDQPAFDRSTRDGFAVQAGALNASAGLRLLGQLRAGEIWRGANVDPHSAVEIMTGAPLPLGADAVVMVEHVQRVDDIIRLAPGRALTARDNVVPRASEARSGEELLPAGTRLDAAGIALAASCGCADLTVFARPMVAIVATGDELVELHQTSGPQQIFNSNSYAIAAMTHAAGGHPGRLAIARDLREEVWKRVAQGRLWDLLILSGGVSMGEYDLVEEVLAQFGAEFLFTGVTMQPGKPVVFGRLPARQHHPNATPEPECYFFGLPGNPISTQVTFHSFVEPFLRALAGEIGASPRWAQATLSDDVPAKPALTRLLPARMQGVNVRVIGWQGSGDQAANARANCYAELLPGVAHRAGDVIRVLLR